jgi:hypothetical protein
MESAPTQKKGMSKGCLVAIIVAASLAVLLLILAVTCWYYKDDLVKMAGTAAISSIKTKLAENPPEGVDTVYFNAVADRFNQLQDEQKEVDLVKYQEFLQTMQFVAGQKELDADLVDRAVKAMIAYYPELRGIEPPGGAAMSPTEEQDTLSDTTP